MHKWGIYSWFDICNRYILEGFAYVSMSWLYWHDDTLFVLPWCDGDAMTPLLRFVPFIQHSVRIPRDGVTSGPRPEIYSRFVAWKKRRADSVVSEIALFVWVVVKCCCCCWWCLWVWLSTLLRIQLHDPSIHGWCPTRTTHTKAPLSRLVWKRDRLLLRALAGRILWDSWKFNHPDRQVRGACVRLASASPSGEESPRRWPRAAHFFVLLLFGLVSSAARPLARPCRHQSPLWNFTLYRPDRQTFDTFSNWAHQQMCVAFNYSASVFFHL